MERGRLAGIAVCACSLLLAEAAVAAQPAAPSAPAQELARLIVPKETWSLGLQQLAEGLQRNLERHPGAKLEYPKDFQSKARAEVEAALPYEDLVDMHAKELAANYTEGEMKEMSTFFRTPLGKKWLQAQPKVSEAVAVQTQQRFAQKMPEIMNKLAQLAKGPEGGAKAAAPAKKPAADPAKKPAAPAPAKKPAEPAKPAAEAAK